MQIIDHNSMNVHQILTKLGLMSHLSVSNFSLIGVCTCESVYGRFCKVCEMKKNKGENYNKTLAACILERAVVIFFTFGILTPLAGGHFCSKCG